MLGKCIDNVRKNVPLVHNITNYVTVNDVAMGTAQSVGVSISATLSDVTDGSTLAVVFTAATN